MDFAPRPLATPVQLPCGTWIDGEPMRRIDVGIETITYLAFSPDGAQLAVAGEEGIALGVWPDLIEKRGAFTRIASQERAAQVVWHPDSYHFAVAILDTAVQVWNRRMRRPRELMDLAGQEGHML